jgi:hypothetical protein
MNLQLSIILLGVKFLCVLIVIEHSNVILEDIYVIS